MTQVLPETLVLALGFRLVITFKTKKLYSATKRLILQFLVQFFLKFPVVQTLTLGLEVQVFAGHLVLPHEPIHPLNVHDLSMFQQLDSKDFNLFGGGIKFHPHMRGVPTMAELM